MSEDHFSSFFSWYQTADQPRWVWLTILHTCPVLQRIPCRNQSSRADRSPLCFVRPSDARTMQFGRSIMKALGSNHSPCVNSVTNVTADQILCHGICWGIYLELNGLGRGKLLLGSHKNIYKDNRIQSGDKSWPRPPHPRAILCNRLFYIKGLDTIGTSHQLRSAFLPRILPCSVPCTPRDVGPHFLLLLHCHPKLEALDIIFEHMRSQLWSTVTHSDWFHAMCEEIIPVFGIVERC